MKAPIRRPGVASPAEPCPALSLPGGLSLADVRRKVILETLAANEGNIKGTASVLCISRRSLYPSSPAEPNPPARPRPRVCRLAPPVELPAGLTWPQIRKAVVLAALKANRGRKGATARALGIAPASLFDYLEQLRGPVHPCPPLTVPGTWTLHQVRAHVVSHTLEVNDGDPRRAAQALQMGRRNLPLLVEAAQEPAPLELPGGLTWDEIRARLVAHVLAAYGGNKKATARALGISVRSMHKP